MRKILLAAVVCFLLCGCFPLGKAKYESYHPIIKDLTDYPGGMTREAFWNERSRWLVDMSANGLTEREKDMLEKLFDSDTVYEAREAQIKAYNEWARAQNQKNGYLEF